MRNVDSFFNKGRLMKYTVKVNIYYQGYRERTEIDIIRRQKQSVILEILQLASYNLEINQRIGEVKMTKCPEECGKQQKPKQEKSEQQKQREKKKRKRKRRERAEEERKNKKEKEQQRLRKQSKSRKFGTKKNKQQSQRKRLRNQFFQGFTSEFISLERK